MSGDEVHHVVNVTGIVMGALALGMQIGRASAQRTYDEVRMMLKHADEKLSQAERYVKEGYEVRKRTNDG
jgi:hypothetical protein